MSVDGNWTWLCGCCTKRAEDGFCFCYFTFQPLSAYCNAHLDFRLISFSFLVITNVSSLHDSRVSLRMPHDLVGQETIAYVRIQGYSFNKSPPPIMLYIFLNINNTLCTKVSDLFKRLVMCLFAKYCSRYFVDSGARAYGIVVDSIPHAHWFC